jgi:PAS domain S-box-containing protein
MREKHKTKEQLTNELVEMPQRSAELEASEAERKRAAEMVRESEEHYRFMVDSIDLGINFIDCDHNLVMVNAAQARHFNKSPREMVGKKCYRELEKRDAVCPYCPGVEAIATGRPAQVETHGVRDDGSRFNVRLRAFPVFRQDGTVIGFVEIGQDITERKAAEEALAWERNLLRALMDTIPDHIYFKDTDSRFIRVSKALAEWFGLSDPMQAVGKTDFDFFTEEHARPAYEDEQRIVRTGQPLVGMEERETWPDRPDTWVWTSKVPLRDEGGKIVGTFGVSRDITDRKRAEEKIEHLNLVLCAIRNVNQLITRERNRDRLLQGVCETLIESRGYHSAWIALLDGSGGLVMTAEAGLGEDFLPLVERLKRGELTDCGQRALKHSGGIVTQDPSFTCADCPLSSMYGDRGAMTVRLGYGGKVYGLLSISIPRDLTADEEERALFEEVAGDIAFALYSVEQEEERKRAEEALRANESKYRTLVENIPQKIFVKDRNSVYVSTNENYARDLGITPEAIAGKVDYDFFPRELADKYRGDDQRIMELGKTEEIEEKYIQDGQEVWVQTIKTPIRNEQADVVGILGIFWDITERKRTEEALRRRITELATLNEIGRAISSAMKLDDLLDLTYHQTSRVMEVSAFYIALYDQEKDELHFHGMFRSPLLG